MIHPFARFSAVPTAGETLWQRAALIERPAVEFAAFLKARQGATLSGAIPGAADPDSTPQRAASSIAEPPIPTSPPRLRPPHQTAAMPPPLTLVSPPHSAVEALPPAEGAETASPAGSGGPPHFPDVPDSARYPAGPYRQAPPEYGAEWWLVNPFTGDAPWLHQDLAGSPVTSPASKYAAENLPQDFRQAFGEMPVRRTGESGAGLVARISRWKQDLEFFQRTGIPEGFEESQVELASAVYEQWGMGQPVFYEGRYGWFARFPDSALPDFEMDAASAVQASHLAIARFQVRLLREGVELPAPHPFVPPHLLSRNT